MNACTLLADFHCRCDQNRWLHGGTYPVKFGDIRITKKSSSIDLKGMEAKLLIHNFEDLNIGMLRHTMYCIILEITLSLKDSSIETVK